MPPTYCDACAADQDLSNWLTTDVITTFTAPMFDAAHIDVPDENTPQKNVCPAGTTANTSGKPDFSGGATEYGQNANGTADQFANQKTANGEMMDPTAMTAASVRLRGPNGGLLSTPLIRIGTSLVVSVPSNPSKSVVVRVNDTGRLGTGVILDLTPAAMKALTGKAYNRTQVNAYTWKKSE
ncbi:MAG TPA: septal ring lytic transglycosylase RlpA family protein [Caulobacteraceae bacterium]|jgi:rare lipoprotein A (peptidoglycan hydrolase)